ncbi:MAG: flagellar biosynthetic protein FliR [Ignavibacterium sp.]
MTNILVTDFITVFFIFLRASGLFFTAPFFSENVIPVLAKIFISMIVAYIVFFFVKPFEFNYDQGLLMLALIGIKEILIGMIIGFSLNFIFYGINFAGSLIGFDLGLSMAVIFDPNYEIENNIIGRILFFASLLILILINGHHYIVRAVSLSYQLIPIGELKFNDSLLTLMIKLSAGVFAIAIKIAAPILISFFLLYIGMGIMSRMIPQMQIFFVVQPLQIGLGIFLLVVFLPVLFFVIKGLLGSLEENILNLIRAMV